MSLKRSFMKQKESMDSETVESVENLFVEYAQLALDKGVAEYQLPAVTATQPAAYTATFEDFNLSANLVIKDSRPNQDFSKLLEIINNVLPKLALTRKNLSNLLTYNKVFKDMQEDDVILLHRFVTKRDHFLKTHHFHDAKTFAAIIGIQDQNTPRKMKSMREKNQLICVKTGDTFLYPEFQVNNQGVVFEDLQQVLPRFLEFNRSGWDICFWLFTEQTVLMKRAKLAAKKLTGLSFDEMMEVGEIASAQSQYVTTMPIEALRKGEKDIFLSMVDEWLSPDLRAIDSPDSREIAVG